jgi:hypothetical protein
VVDKVGLPALPAGKISRKNKFIPVQNIVLPLLAKAQEEGVRIQNRIIMDAVKNSGLSIANPTLRKYIDAILEANPQYKKVVKFHDLLIDWDAVRSYLIETKSFKKTFEYFSQDLPELSALGFFLMLAIDPRFDAIIQGVPDPDAQGFVFKTEPWVLLADEEFVSAFKKLSDFRKMSLAWSWKQRIMTWQRSAWKSVLIPSGQSFREKYFLRTGFSRDISTKGARESRTSSRIFLEY